jgi:hypothetical protein
MAASRHVVLLGDSIFDNGAYSGDEPDVITHLQRVLPSGWRATSCAVDGATTSTLAGQLACVPGDASDIVVAIGGNDALQNIDLLSFPVSSSTQALQVFADRLAVFERSYREAIDTVLALGRHTAVCTVYNGALEPSRAPVARVGLSLFNDAILRTAIALRLDAVELRNICTDAEDYANPIEPSGRGGLKIARAIAHLLGALKGDVPARIWAQH